MTTNAKRGDTVKTEGRASGRYVGRTAAGTIWVAYDEADFAAMCERFDALTRKTAPKLTAELRRAVRSHMEDGGCSRREAVALALAGMPS